MSKTSRLMVLSLTTVVIVICAVQAKAMPPRMYKMIQDTVAMIGTTSMYNGVPVNSIDWFNGKRPPR